MPKSEKSNWSTNLIDWPEGENTRLVPLDMDISTGPGAYDSINLIDQMAGDQRQGDLFAYMFRRFGLPNMPSDPDRELAKYLLSTPHPKMVLAVTPRCEKEAHWNFRFLVSPEVRSDLEEWPKRDQAAHKERLLNWMKQEGNRPDWADEWVEQCKAEWDLTSWQATFRRMLPLLIGEVQIGKIPADSKKAKWVQKSIRVYEASFPRPIVQERTPDWRNWPDDDPMKSYVAAAEATLADLKKVVALRDLDIGIHGHEEEGHGFEGSDYATAAEFPSGAMCNADPELFNEIYEATLRLGGGDLHAGMKAALQAINAAHDQKNDTSILTGPRA
jgi:hypothetical protein